MRWIGERARLDASSAQKFFVRNRPDLDSAQLLGDSSRVITGAVHVGVFEVVLACVFQRCSYELVAHSSSMVRFSDCQEGDVEDFINLEQIVELRLCCDGDGDFHELQQVAIFDARQHLADLLDASLRVALVYHDTDELVVAAFPSNVSQSLIQTGGVDFAEELRLLSRPQDRLEQRLLESKVLLDKVQNLISVATVGELHFPVLWGSLRLAISTR